MTLNTCCDIFNIESAYCRRDIADIEGLAITMSFSHGIARDSNGSLILPFNKDAKSPL